MPADSIPTGISENCLYNEHYPACRAGNCHCDCHKNQPGHRMQLAEQAKGVVRSPSNTIDASNTIGSGLASRGPGIAAQTPLYCPKCGDRRPGNERYCRKDGEKLASVVCPKCKSVGDPSDTYCHGCGIEMAKAREAGYVADSLDNGSIMVPADAKPSDLDSLHIEGELGEEVPEAPALVESREDIAKAQAILAAMSAADPSMAEAVATDIMMGAQIRAAVKRGEVDPPPTIKVSFGRGGVLEHGEAKVPSRMRDIAASTPEPAAVEQPPKSAPRGFKLPSSAVRNGS
jgi:hypothetical protein